MFRSLPAILLMLSAALAPARADDAVRLASLSGTYASVAAEPWYGAYGTRSFTFDRGRWSLDFLFALDPGMTKPVFRFRTEGPYRLSGPSTIVPGAFNAVFGEERKWVTLLTADAELAQRVGLDRCGLTPGAERDISVSGCANWRPVAICGEDHDLLAIDKAGALRFGVRPRDNDMCTAEKRPTQLLEPTVVRR